MIMENSENGHGKSWKNHGILFLYKCMNPVSSNLCDKGHTIGTLKESSSLCDYELDSSTDKTGAKLRPLSVIMISIPVHIKQE
mgnify:CR=1 FL=1